MDEKDLYDATVKYVPKTFTLENYLDNPRDIKKTEIHIHRQHQNLRRHNQCENHTASPEKKASAEGGAHKKKITPAKVGRFLFSIVRGVIVFGI